MLNDSLIGRIATRQLIEFENFLRFNTSHGEETNNHAMFGIEQILNMNGVALNQGKCTYSHK